MSDTIQEIGQKILETRRRVSDAALCHYAEVGRQAAEIADELADDKITPDEKPYDLEKRRVLLRKLLTDHLCYVARGLDDLVEVGLCPPVTDEEKAKCT